MEGFLALFLIGLALGIWYAVDRKSFFEVFTGKKAPTLPSARQDKPASTAMERIPHYGQSGYEDIGYINEPKQQAVVPASRHEIIRHDFYMAKHNGNLWPRWTCKCGASSYQPTSVYQSLEETQADVRREGQKHVVDSTKADEMLRKTNGNFAF